MDAEGTARMKYAPSWELVRFVAAAILLLATGLKLAGWKTSPTGEMGLLSLPMFQVGIVLWEILLGLWLLLGGGGQMGRRNFHFLHLSSNQFALGLAGADNLRLLWLSRCQPVVGPGP
jgi:hypothetical protein